MRPASQLVCSRACMAMMTSSAPKSRSASSIATSGSGSATSPVAAKPCSAAQASEAWSRRRAFSRQIRLCYPRRIRLYWIQDNLSANWTPDIRQFADENNIELVPLPTYASYLNRIAAHFRPITEFVVNNADYLDWDAFAHALANQVRDRNGSDRDRRIAERERRLMIAA